MSQIRVLIADAGPGVHEYLVDMLTAHGMIARGFEDSRAALEHLRGAPYDVLLLDVWAQGSGFEVLRRIREFNGDIAVIFMLTNDSVPAGQDDVWELNVAGWVKKPFAGEELRANVLRAARNRALLMRGVRAVPAAVGGRIKVAREQRSISSEQFCKFASLTQIEATALEHGRMTPSLAFVYRLACAWGLDLEELLADPE